MDFHILILLYCQKQNSESAVFVTSSVSYIMEFPFIFMDDFFSEYHQYLEDNNIRIKNKGLSQLS